MLEVIRRTGNSDSRRVSEKKRELPESDVAGAFRCWTLQYQAADPAQALLPSRVKRG